MGNRRRLPREKKSEFVVSSVNIGRPGTRVYLSNPEIAQRLRYHRLYPMTMDECYKTAKDRYDGVLRKLAE